MRIFISYKSLANFGLFLFKVLIALVAAAITTLFCLIMDVSDFRNGGFTVIVLNLTYVYMTYLFNWLREEKARKAKLDIPNIQPISGPPDGMVFGLGVDETDELNKWQEGIREEFGEYGLYTFTFEPNGIGTAILVHSKIANRTLDLSHPEKW